MGLILMTLTMPNTLQLSACQQLILARSPEAWGPNFEGEDVIVSRSQKAQGVPFLSPFYLPHFLNCPSNPQFVGSEVTEEIDKILVSNSER